MQWFNVLFSSNAVESFVRSKLKKNHAKVNKKWLQDFEIQNQHSFDDAS